MNELVEYVLHWGHMQMNNIPLMEIINFDKVDIQIQQQDIAKLGLYQNHNKSYLNIKTINENMTMEAIELLKALLEQIGKLYAQNILLKQML